MLWGIVIERDFRLTGAYREQSDKPIAPEEFKTNSWWKVRTISETLRQTQICVMSRDFWIVLLTGSIFTGREEILSRMLLSTNKLMLSFAWKYEIQCFIYFFGSFQTR